MPESTDELRAEIARLERENRELKSRAKTPSVSEKSIEGMDVFAMRIGADESIVHVNTAFARHLGLASKEEVIGQKAAVLRRFLNQELLTAIVRPAEGQSQVRMAHDDRGKVFEIKTTLHGGMLDVVMQDVTDEQEFRSLVQRYILKDFDTLSDEDLRTFKFPERRFMTVSFTDLRGFTALTERLSPEVHASSAQLLLALRHGGFDQIKSLATERSGHRYLYVQRPLTADEAGQFCAKAGGHLVTIANKEENAWLNEIVPPKGTCRLGLIVTDGKPQWLNGEPVTFIPEFTDFRESDRFVTWKGGAWLPLSAKKDKPMAFVIEWD